MSRADVRKQTGQFVQGYLNEINTITENASTVDKAGQWGLDGWIRTIHDLIDLQVRTYAAVLQATIAGPWWTDQPDEPIAADPIPVDEPKDYPRALSASTFKRVGIPESIIPPYSLGFEPEILPAGATEFRIVLKDDRFLGANYEGVVYLTPTSGTAAKPDTQKVIVGL